MTTSLATNSDCARRSVEAECDRSVSTRDYGWLIQRELHGGCRPLRGAAPTPPPLQRGDVKQSGKQGRSAFPLAPAL
jgi:hypothetical protein